MALKGFKCILNTTFLHWVLGYPPLYWLPRHAFLGYLVGVVLVVFSSTGFLFPISFTIRQSCIVLVSKRKWFIKVSGAICNPHWSFPLSLTLWVQVLLCGKMNYKGPFRLEINCAEYCLFITNSYESQRTDSSPGQRWTLLTCLSHINVASGQHCNYCSMNIIKFGLCLFRNSCCVLISEHLSCVWCLTLL